MGIGEESSLEEDKEEVGRSSCAHRKGTLSPFLFPLFLFYIFREDISRDLKTFRRMIIASTTFYSCTRISRVPHCSRKNKDGTKTRR